MLKVFGKKLLNITHAKDNAFKNKNIQPKIVKESRN